MGRKRQEPGLDPHLCRDRLVPETAGSAPPPESSGQVPGLDWHRDADHGLAHGDRAVMRRCRVPRPAGSMLHSWGFSAIRQPS